MAKRWWVTTVILVIASTIGAAQGTPKGGGVPKTPWGDPDLQGVWDYWTFTPLERPKEFGNRATMTQAEAEEYGKRLQRQALAVDTEGPGKGQTGAYGQELWTDRARGGALRQTSIIVDPEDGLIPPLTPQAEKQRTAPAVPGQPVRSRTTGPNSDDPEARGLAERCLLGFSTGPPFQPGGYNNNVQIVQTPGYVMLFLEMNHDVRIIPTDGRPHLPSNLRPWLGDSRGRWEGSTLVVETTNFSPKVAAFSIRRGAGGFEIGSGENLRLIERFNRIDANTLQYEFTVHDPTTFTRPFTGRLPMNLTDQLMYEYACHEGNYGLENILRGARIEEKLSREGK
jgi:hypothetical protein